LNKLQILNTILSIFAAPSPDSDPDKKRSRQTGQFKLAPEWNGSELPESQILFEDHKIPPEYLLELLVKQVKTVSVTLGL